MDKNVSKKYKAVVFDFDYTLADATTGIVDTYSYSLSTLGYPPQDAHSICLTIGMTVADAFTSFTGITERDKVEQFRETFRKRADEVMTAGTVLLPYARETLSYLREAGVRLGIVTSKNGYRISECFEHFGMSGAVDMIIGFDNVKQAKPSPEGLERVIDSFQIDKEEVLYVGDNVIDAQTAQSAGVDFAAVLTGTTARESFLDYNHRYIVKNLEELFEKTRGYGYGE
ncbi:MAG: HAD family hydrolase [Eubacteriales bacterium]